MEFNTVIEARRSIRKFSAHPVFDQDIKVILEAARLSPSAKNRQPWLFMVLKDEDKNEIVHIMKSIIGTKDLPDFVNASLFSAQSMEEAGAIILILKEKEPLWHDGDMLSIGACIENMCLCATDLGLGALWIRDTEFTKEIICQHIGYPELELVSVLAIGYPNESPKARPRKTLDQLLLKKKHQ